MNTSFRLNGIDDDVAFVRRVMANDKSAVGYFLETYSKPLLEYVGRNVLKLMPLPIYSPQQNKPRITDCRQQELDHFDEYSYGIGCYGMYYEFIAALFEELSHKPQWNKLGYYAENPRSRFYTYLSVITVRHFLRHHPDREKSGSVDETSSFDENERLYLLLSLKLQDKDEEMFFTEQMYQELEMARGMLKTRDAKIIQLAIIEDLPTMEIAAQMEDEFETDLSTMSRRDIQTRISQWRNRALVRLSGFITADKNRHLFPSLLNYAKSKRF